MASEEVSAAPVPVIADVIDKSFWEEVQKEKLPLQKCLDCGQLQFPPAPVCSRCFSSNLGWEQAKGTGRIYSFTAIHVPRHPVIRKHVESSGRPIILAFIDLDEQVRIESEIVDCAPEDVTLGARVTLTFGEILGTNFKIPKFRLIN